MTEKIGHDIFSLNKNSKADRAHILKLASKWLDDLPFRRMEPEDDIQMKRIQAYVSAIHPSTEKEKKFVEQIHMKITMVKNIQTHTKEEIKESKFMQKQAEQLRKEGII